MNEIIIQDDVMRCPICGSKKITEVSQNVLIKNIDANTHKEISSWGKKYVSNKEKAVAYDRASTEGVGCWHFDCRECNWMSKLYVE